MTKKLSTKNVSLDPPVSAGGVKPVIQPGNHEIQILNAELRKDPNYGDKLILTVETRPLGDGFKGLAKDKNDPSKGNYAGQIGWVNYSRYNFKDFTTEGGVQILRDDELFRAIGTLCRNIGLGLADWWDAQDGKHDTVDQLTEAFIKEKPFAGVWFYACIAGKEYMSGKYVNYELFLPREDRTLGKAVSLNKDKVQKFFEHTHLVRLQPKSTNEEPANEPQSQSATPTKKQETTSGGSMQNNLSFLDELNADADTQRETLEKKEEARKAAESKSVNDDKAPWEL